MSEFSDFSDDMPSVDGDFNPTLDQLLSHIRGGTLSELTDGSDVSVININSTPQIASEIWVGPDGDPVSSFGRKFDEGFEGWKPGEVVNAQFVVTERDGQPALLVSDRYIGDIRHADTFVLTGLDEDAARDLRSLGMAMVDVDVEVMGDAEYRVSNMFDYEARIRRVNAVQQVWDGEGEPSPGDQLLLQGEVVEYERGEVDYKTASFPVTKILLPNGRVVEVEMFNGEINYESGNLDFFYPKEFQVGDVVQLNTTFSNISNWQEHADRPPTFHAVFCRSAFLLTPGQDRQETYDSHRADIAARLTVLRGLEGQEFRNAYADLMNAYLENPDAKMTRSLMTDAEKAEVDEIAKERFADNPNEGPVLNYHSAYEMAEINRGYGVDVFGMSRAEFYQFCLGVANGSIVADVTKESSVDYPWRVLTSEYSEEDQLTVLKIAATAGIERTSGKKVIHRSGDLTDPENEISFDQEYLTDQSIAYLSGVDGIESTDFLYGITASMVNEAVSDPDHAHKAEDRVSDPTLKLISALDHSLRSAGVWDIQNGWTAVEDPVRLDYFMSRTHELQSWVDAFNSMDGRMDGYTAAKIQEVVEMISLLATLPPQVQQ